MDFIALAKKYIEKYVEDYPAEMRFTCISFAEWLEELQKEELQKEELQKTHPTPEPESENSTLI